MAEALYIHTKTRRGGAETFINGINCVVSNQSDGATATERKAAAAAACTATEGVTFPSTYFDEEQVITTASGALGDPGDAYVIRPGEGVAKNKVEGA